MNHTYTPPVPQAPARYRLIGKCPRCASATPGADAKPLMLPHWPAGLAAWICAPCWVAGPPADTEGATAFFAALMLPNGADTGVTVLARRPGAGGVQ